MSLNYTVVVTTNGRTARDRMLSALNAWIETQERGGAFGTVIGYGMADDADAIVGQVNHLNVDSLKLAIWNESRVSGWTLWDPVGLVIWCEDAGSLPVFSLLNEKGEWR